MKSVNIKKITYLLKNAGWIFFDKIFRIATSLIVSVWLARYLGPEKFGVLNYVYTFPLLFSAVASLGLTSTLYNEFVIQKDEFSFKELFTTSLIMKLLASIFALLLTILVGSILETDKALILLIVISSISLIAQGLDIVDTYFQSQRKVQYSIIPKLIVLVVATAFRVVGLWNGFSLIFFVTITTTEIFLSSLISFFICKNYIKFKFNDLSINFSIVKDLFRRSWPLMISELCLFLYVRVDLLMIKHLSTEVELGNYSVAMRITDLWYFIPTALTASLYPSIIAIRQSDYQEYLSRYQRMLSAFALISISIGILLTVTANPIISFLYGNKYAGVGSVLSINVWTGLFVFLAIGSDNWFIVENLQRFVLQRTIAGAVLNIILNFVLIPYFGAVGASVATLIAQLSVSFLMNGIYSRTREVFSLQANALIFLPKFVTGLVRRAF